VPDRTVLALFGPTASGKTAVAEAISDRVSAAVISADSMQVYRGLPVLTAQPTRPTALVGIWDLDQETSVAEYQRLAHDAVDDALAAGRTPVVAGGTGLYLRAALADLQLPPPPRAGERQRWERLYDRAGPERAHAFLVRRDPRAAERIHPNDRRRVVRALELAEAGSSLAPGRDVLWSEELRQPTLIIGLEVPHDELSRRIVQRTLGMFEAGVVDEVHAALARPLSHTAQQIIGLREIADLSPAAAIEAVIVRTRRYAAYQRKWMRRIPGLASVAADRPPGEIADEILEMARSRERLPAHRGAAGG
jgi:tRNA dimethylallyltransferase